MRTFLAPLLLLCLGFVALSCSDDAPLSPTSGSFEAAAKAMAGQECVNGLGGLANGAQYGFAAGNQNGGPRIHIRYQDHKAGINLSGGLPISVTDLGGGQWSFEGTCRIGGKNGYTFEVIVTDDGSHDEFVMTVSNGYSVSEDVTAGYISSGCENR